MLARENNPFAFPASRRLAGRLDFRAPEDRFATDDEMLRRDDEAVRSPVIDHAITQWNAAKGEGDERRLQQAARALIEATAGHFRMSGVPLFAHPPLPPQFVAAEVATVDGTSHTFQAAALNHVVAQFEPTARALVARQFSAALDAGARTIPDDGGSDWIEDPRSPMPANRGATAERRPAPYQREADDDARRGRASHGARDKSGCDCGGCRSTWFYGR